MNNSFNTGLGIIYRAPRGSVLGPLLFNIYRNNLFFSEEFRITNFSDYCSPYDFCLNIWYRFNYLKPNPDKWHLILSEKGSTNFLYINRRCIFNENQKILGVNCDNKLNFEYHLGKLCNKKKVIMNSFITSIAHLGMCQNRIIHRQIDRIPERKLRIANMDNNSSIEGLLLKSGSFIIHYTNLQQMVIEIYKILIDLSSSLMAELFCVKEKIYNLRNNNALIFNIPRSTEYVCMVVIQFPIWHQRFGK